MRHARDDALDALEPLLVELRKVDGLRERKRGNFVRGARAFLHFHEDPEGLFADLRGPEDWERFPVTRAAERKRLLAQVRKRLRNA